jgi:hypothetical protein
MILDHAQTVLNTDSSHFTRKLDETERQRMYYGIVKGWNGIRIRGLTNCYKKKFLVFKLAHDSAMAMKSWQSGSKPLLQSAVSY